MQRRAAPDHHASAQHAFAGGLRRKNDGVAFAEGQADGFAQSLPELSHQRQGFAAHIETGVGFLHQADQVPPQDVQPIFIAIQPAVVHG
jgi:hypothetical protein